MSVVVMSAPAQTERSDGWLPFVRLLWEELEEIETELTGLKDRTKVFVSEFRAVQLRILLAGAYRIKRAQLETFREHLIDLAYQDGEEQKEQSF